MCFFSRVALQNRNFKAIYIFFWIKKKRNDDFVFCCLKYEFNKKKKDIQMFDYAFRPICWVSVILCRSIRAVSYSFISITFTTDWFLLIRNIARNWPCNSGSPIIITYERREQNIDVLQIEQIITGHVIGSIFSYIEICIPMTLGSQ